MNVSLSPSLPAWHRINANEVVVEQISCRKMNNASLFYCSLFFVFFTARTLAHTRISTCVGTAIWWWVRLPWWMNWWSSSFLRAKGQVCPVRQKWRLTATSMSSVLNRALVECRVRMGWMHRRILYFKDARIASVRRTSPNKRSWGGEEKKKKRRTQKQKQQQQLPSNYSEGQIIKQPLQISKVFLRLHQHMFYIFYLA